MESTLCILAKFGILPFLLTLSVYFHINSIYPVYYNTNNLFVLSYCKQRKNNLNFCTVLFGRSPMKHATIIVDGHNNTRLLIVLTIHRYLRLFIFSTNSTILFTIFNRDTKIKYAMHRQANWFIMVIKISVLQYRSNINDS